MCTEVYSVLFTLILITLFIAAISKADYLLRLLKRKFHSWMERNKALTLKEIMPFYFHSVSLINLLYY